MVTVASTVSTVSTEPVTPVETTAPVQEVEMVWARFNRAWASRTFA